MSKPRMASSPRATYVTIRVPSAMRSLPICRGTARRRQNSVSTPSWMTSTFGCQAAGSNPHCQRVGV